MAAEERELDLAAALGAEREASTQVLSVYIPNKNRHGRPINPRPWIREAPEGSWFFRIKEYDEGGR